MLHDLFGTKPSILLSLFAMAALVQAPSAPKAPPQAPAAAPTSTKGSGLKPPTELFEIVKVVDGDTIHIKRAGKVEKLRLLSVDTEEKFSSGTAPGGTKPPTVFGEECALWAQKFFADLGKDGAAPRIGISFPGGHENYDFYGRLLCHVILPDGTDYNLMLVKLGKSPYFSKYGFSESEHAAFVAAQKEAQTKQLGIWNPKTNVPATDGAPAAKRPYDKLVPWWDARGEAVQAWRAAFAKDAAAVCDANESAQLERAARGEKEVEVFGEIDRMRDEPDGSITVHFRASMKDKALVVTIPKEQREAHAALALATLGEEFHQNYVWFRGLVRTGPKGFLADSDSATRWRRAGPEPKLPKEG